jgi:hypothetical protein
MPDTKFVLKSPNPLSNLRCIFYSGFRVILMLTRTCSFNKVHPLTRLIKLVCVYDRRCNNLHLTQSSTYISTVTLQQPSTTCTSTTPESVSVLALNKNDKLYCYDVLYIISSNFRMHNPCNKKSKISTSSNSTLLITVSII